MQLIDRQAAQSCCLTLAALALLAFSGEPGLVEKEESAGSQGTRCRGCRRRPGKGRGW